MLIPDRDLEKWTNAQLDLLYEPTALDIALVGGRLSAEGIAELGGERKAKRWYPPKNQELFERNIRKQEEYVQEMYRRGRVMVALDKGKGDKEAALKLAGSDPAFLRMIARYKRAQGRAKGEARSHAAAKRPAPRRLAAAGERTVVRDFPGDHSDTTRYLLDDLESETKVVLRLWQQHGKTPREPKPNARAIVIRRYICQLKGLDSFDDVAFDEEADEWRDKLINWAGNAARRRRARLK
jgi:hypothetical protein